jgi:hypothetical protein
MGKYQEHVDLEQRDIERRWPGVGDEQGLLHPLAGRRAGRNGH